MRFLRSGIAASHIVRVPLNSMLDNWHLKFLATSAIARLRNPRMSAFAKRVSAVFLHSGAKANDFMRLNHLDNCMSHDRVIRDEVEARKYTIQRCCCGKSRQLVNGFDC